MGGEDWARAEDPPGCGKPGRSPGRGRHLRATADSFRPLQAVFYQEVPLAFQKQKRNVHESKVTSWKKVLSVSWPGSARPGMM